MIKEIMFIADPMCSWCWGFSPVIHKLMEDYNQDYNFKLYLGGLRVGEEVRLDENFKKKLTDSWTRVKKLTGQEFNLDFLKRDGFIYNTEPSCRAVAVVRELKKHLSFQYLDNLHRAFYLENSDITDSDFLLEEALKLNLDKVQFLNLFNDKEFQNNLHDEFEFISNLGVQVFPAVLLHTDTGFTILSQGFHPYYKLKSDLENSFLRRA